MAIHSPDSSAQSPPATGQVIQKDAGLLLRTVLLVLGGMPLLLLLIGESDYIHNYCWVAHWDVEITFLVTDADTGQPISGATVDVHSWSDDEEPKQEEFRLTTDSHGAARGLCRHCFACGTHRPFQTDTFGVQVQSWSLQVSAPGYATSQREGFTPEAERSAQRTEDGAALTIPLALHRLPPSQQARP